MSDPARRALLLAEASELVDRLGAISSELRDLGFGPWDEVNSRIGHDPNRSPMRTVDIQALVAIARSNERTPV